MFALVKCGQVRCHLLACPCQILPQNSCQHHMFAIINSAGGQPFLDVKLVFSLCKTFPKNNAAQLLINHVSLIKVYAWMVQICGQLFYFSHATYQALWHGLWPLLVSIRIGFWIDLEGPFDHWTWDFQATLPPSCHFCSTSPLQVSRNGLSCPGLDARHFPDTLKN